MKKILIFCMAFMVSFTPWTLNAASVNEFDFTDFEIVTDESEIEILSNLKRYSERGFFGPAYQDFRGSYISYNAGNGITQEYMSGMEVGVLYEDLTPGISTLDSFYLYDLIDLQEGNNLQVKFKINWTQYFIEKATFDPSEDVLPNDVIASPSTVRLYVNGKDGNIYSSSINTSCELTDDGFTSCDFLVRNFEGFGTDFYIVFTSFNRLTNVLSSRPYSSALKMIISEYDIKSISNDESVGLLEGLIDWVKGIYNAITGQDDVTTDKVDEVTGSNQELVDKSDQLADIENDLTNQFDSAIGNLDTNLDLLDVSDFVSSAQFLSVNMSRIVSSNNYIQYMITFSLVLGFALVLIGRGLK